MHWHISLKVLFAAATTIFHLDALEDENPTTLPWTIKSSKESDAVRGCDSSSSTPITDWFAGYKTGPKKDQWTHYLSAYEEVMNRFCAKSEVRLLEIGIQSGGGFRMWSAYFGERLKYTGIDLNPLAATFEGLNGAHIFIGDARNHSLLLQAAQKGGPFDVVIDDGGHWEPLMSATFDVFYLGHTRMADDGTLCVEDVHTQYWGAAHREKKEVDNGNVSEEPVVPYQRAESDVPEVKEGELRPRTFVGRSKLFVDALNQQSLIRGASHTVYNEYAIKRSSQFTSEVLEAIGHRTHSLRFFPDLICFDRKPRVARLTSMQGGNWKLPHWESLPKRHYIITDDQTRAVIEHARKSLQNGVPFNQAACMSAIYDAGVNTEFIKQWAHVLCPKHLDMF